MVYNQCYIHDSGIINCIVICFFVIPDENSVSVQIACEQHYSWSSLGFVRSVATGPAICHALSSQRWIDLLLKILEEEKAHQQSNVSKQVNTLASNKALFTVPESGLGGSVGCASDWRPGGCGFDTCRGWQYSFVEIDHEMFSTVILSLPLIQEGQLSVSGKRMCTLLVNCLEN